MPAIDLARLRKQANRLADFFFLPDEFMRHLREMLEFYVNHTLTTRENAAPGSNLKTYRTPPAVLKQVENELRNVAEANPEFALGLADILWDEGALETRLLAAYLLGRIPPHEERLLPRLSAWTQQIRDPDVRSALLSTSLMRMRKETPAQFLNLIREYLHPARMQTWSNGIQALLPMIADTNNVNLPPIFDMVEPIIDEAPSTLQNDLSELINALFRGSANETIFMLKHVLTNTKNPLAVITLRRISTSFPLSLQTELRDLIHAEPISMSKKDLIDDDFITEEVFVPQTNQAAIAVKKPRTKIALRIVDEDPASADKKTVTRKKNGKDNSKLIYLHGLESSSQSGKARQFAELFPGMLTPDFSGSFEERMRQLKPILGRKKNWTIIGSSYGGLMGGVFTCSHPEQVKKLILLAPALSLPEFADQNFSNIDVPTVLIHGKQDEVVPPAAVKLIAEKIFSNLKYIAVEDGHRLHKAFVEINWEEILS